MLLSKLKKHTAVAALLSISLPVTAQTIGEVGEDSVTVISPKKKVAEVKTAQIDDERFEVGIFTGMMSIEDFDTNVVNGFTVNYHINSRFMASFIYGKTGEANATFEENEGASFVADREQGLQFTGVTGSYKLFQGRSYLSKKLKFNSHIHFGLGVENVKFAGESYFGMAMGLNYKTVLTDWLTADVNFRDHIFNRDWLEESKTTHNLEYSLGLNILF